MRVCATALWVCSKAVLTLWRSDRETNRVAGKEDQHGWLREKWNADIRAVALQQLQQRDDRQGLSGIAGSRHMRRQLSGNTRDFRCPGMFAPSRYDAARP